jgi:hypothetical protein
MWKVVAFLLAVFILGHFAIRYVRKNPLDPQIDDGGDVVVESRDYRVHFDRNGAVAGTYFLSSATNLDWTSHAVNARLQVFGSQAGTDYMREYPDFHLYGSASGQRLADVATPLSLIAANRETYGVLFQLLDRNAQRVSDGGERLCVTLSGEVLSVSAAESLEDGRDATASLGQTSSEPTVYVDKLDYADCSDVVAAAARR